MRLNRKICAPLQYDWSQRIWVIILYDLKLAEYRSVFAVNRVGCAIEQGKMHGCSLLATVKTRETQGIRIFRRNIRTSDQEYKI